MIFPDYQKVKLTLLDLVKKFLFIFLISWILLIFIGLIIDLRSTEYSVSEILFSEGGPIFLIFPSAMGSMLLMTTMYILSFFEKSLISDRKTFFIIIFFTQFLVISLVGGLISFPRLPFLNIFTIYPIIVGFFTLFVRIFKKKWGRPPF